MTGKLTRREFMQKAAVGTAGLAVAGSGLFSASRAYGANDRLSIGIVGPGQRGRTLMKDVYNQREACNAEITAVCDIWSRNLDRAVETCKGQYGREPRKFSRLEDMLALENLDGVIVATADFQHAKMLEQVVKAGKDCYCEKPMANDLREARAALKAVQDTGQIVQIGAQRRSEGIYKAAAEALQGGILGTISKFDTQWNYYGARWRRNDVDQVREEDTDWRRFLMGKRYRPWDPHQYMEWRLFRDFSTGIPCQWMSHMIDLVHWLMDEQFPTSAVAHGGTYVWKDGRENGDTFHALLEYPKGFLVSYATRFGNSAGDSTYIYGTNGMLDCQTWTLTGNGGGETKLAEEIKLERLPNENHMKNWLDCMRSKTQPNADIFTGYQHSVATIMAAQALSTGKKTFYNPATQQIRTI